MTWLRACRDEHERLKSFLKYTCLPLQKALTKISYTVAQNFLHTEPNTTGAQL